jgi:hypothetical protein
MAEIPPPASAPRPLRYLTITLKDGFWLLVVDPGAGLAGLRELARERVEICWGRIGQPKYVV